jgi:hypothetical protein
MNLIKLIIKKKYIYIDLTKRLNCFIMNLSELIIKKIYIDIYIKELKL